MRVENRNLARDIVDRRDPTGSGMRSGVSRARAERRDSHRSRKLEESWIGGGGGGERYRRRGGSGTREGRTARVALIFPPSKFKSAAAAQKEVSGAMAQLANERRAP